MRHHKGGIIRGLFNLLIVLFLGVIALVYFAVRHDPVYLSSPPPATTPVASAPAAETPENVPSVAPAVPVVTAPPQPVVASSPPQPTVDSLQAAVDSDKAEVQHCESVATAALHASPAYVSAQADAAAKLSILQQARATGAPQEKLDASSAYVAVLQKMKKMDAQAIGSDASRGAAVQKLAADDVSLHQLQSAATAKARADAASAQADAAAAQAAIDNDPVNVAIRKHVLIEGMTYDQAVTSLRTKPYSITKSGSSAFVTWEVYDSEFWSATFYGDSIVVVSHTRL